MTITRETSGYAVQLDGVDDQVTMTNSASLQNCQSTQQLTIAAWVKSAGFALNNSAYRSVVSTGGWEGGTEGFEFSIRSKEATHVDSINFVAQLEAGGIIFAQAPLVFDWDDTTWQHVAITLNGDTREIYLNGVASLVNDQGTGTIKLSSTKAFLIGDGYDRQTTFNGAIDEVAIWSSELSQNDITDLYNDGAGLYIDSTTTFPTCGTSMGTNLQGLWHFDENAGLSASDSSGNANTGTLTNMAEDDWVDGKVVLYETAVDKKTYTFR